MPLVSVIMPSYNHEKFISKSIESILNQTIRDLELIIVDDASIDNSRKIIESYAQKDSRIHFFMHEKNLGISKTVNDAISKTTGDFLALFSSDDLWLPEKIEKELEILKNDENLVVWSEGQVIDDTDNPLGVTFTEMHGAQNKKKSGNIFEELVRGNYICGQSLMVKRENFNIFLYDPKYKYLNDYKIMLELSRSYEFYFIPECLVMYRWHPKNTIQVQRDDCWKEDIALKMEVLSDLSNGFSKTTKSVVYQQLSVESLKINNIPRSLTLVFRAIGYSPLRTPYIVYDYSCAFWESTLKSHHRKN